MSNLSIREFQKEAWAKLFSRDIYDIFDSYTFSKQEVLVNITPSNAEKLRTLGGLSSGLSDTLAEWLEMDINIRATSMEAQKSGSTSGTLYHGLPLIRLPILTDFGFIINGNKRGIVSKLRPASGWYFGRDKQGRLILTLQSGTITRLTICRADRKTKGAAGVYVTGPKLRNQNNTKQQDDDSNASVKIPVFEFLKALSPSVTYKDLLEALQYNRYAYEDYIFSESEPDTAYCAQKVLVHILGDLESKERETQLDPIKRLHTKIYDKNCLRIGEERVPRFHNFVSFLKVVGKELAEDISCDGIEYKAGDVLTNEMAHKLEEAGIEKITIMNDGKAVPIIRMVCEEHITFQEILMAVYHYYLLLDGIGSCDSQDNYCNKIIESVADSFSKYISKALGKVRRQLEEELSAGAAIENVLNIGKLNAALSDIDVIKDIQADTAYQQLEETNSLSLYEQAFRIGGSNPELGVSARDVQKSQFGRVCAYTTAESKKVGLNLALTMLSSVDKYGFITTPVFGVKEGKPDYSEIIHLNSIEERGYAIAPHDIKLETLMEQGPNTICYGCRLDGEVANVPLSQIKYQYVSPCQSVSLLLGCIPGQNRNAGKRLVMGANTLKQSMPLIRTQRPYVTTGVETLADIGVIRAQDVLRYQLELIGDPHSSEDLSKYKLRLTNLGSAENGQQTQVHFTTDYNGGYEFVYDLPRVEATVKNSMRHYKVRFVPGNTYSGKDIVFYANDIDVTSARFNKSTVDLGVLKSSDDLAQYGLAQGYPVKILLASYEGLGYEDSGLVRKGFIANYGLATTQVKKITVKCESTPMPDGSTSIQKFTRYISDLQDSERGYLDDNGMPRVGVTLRSGQVLVGQVTQEVMGDEIITSHSSCHRLGVGESGTVISAILSPDKQTAKITIGMILPLEPGDKLSGPHGDKVTVGAIIADEDMPFSPEFGIPDIILNPLGVPARENLGQLVEQVLGMVGFQKGEIQILEPFSSVTTDKLIANAEQYGIQEVDIYDGRTGEKYERKAFIGVRTLFRSEHISTSKFNATASANDKLSPRSNQPVKGKGGGQKFSELATWCFYSYGATEVLDRMFSLNSDDISGVNKFRAKIRAGYAWDKCGVSTTSHNDDILQAYLRTLGLNMYVDEAGSIEILNNKTMFQIAKGRICNLELGKDRDILRDPEVFGEYKSRMETLTKSKELYGFLPTGFSFVQPIVLSSKPFLSMFYVYKPDGSLSVLTEYMYKAIIAGKVRVKTPPNEKSPIPALEVFKAECHSQITTGICGMMSIINNYDLTTTLKLIDGRLGIPKQYAGMHMGLKLCPVGEIKEKLNIDSELSTEGLGFICWVDEENNMAWVQDNVDRKLLEQRSTIEMFSKYYDIKDVVVSGLLVPPIGYRPMIRNEVSSAFDRQLGAVVRNLVRLQRIPSGQPNSYDIINSTYRDIAAMLNNTKSASADKRQKTVLDELTNHQSKNSVIRDICLSKKVRWSGRSVIIENSKLQLDEVGIPITMATKIFEDHLVSILLVRKTPKCEVLESFKLEDPGKIKRLLMYLAHRNYSGFTSLLGSYTNTYDKFVACQQELVKMLEHLFEYYYVLLNREPSLHKFSVEGMKALPVWTAAIQLHPLCCHGFNADFDGDQMSATFVMHPAAQAEIKQKMMTSKNLINPKDGKLIMAINQDMILGIYWATCLQNNAPDFDLMEASPKAIISAKPELNHFRGCRNMAYEALWDMFDMGQLDVHDVVLVSGVDCKVYKSTVGRVLFNALLPNSEGFLQDGIEGTPYSELLFNTTVTKKVVSKVTDWMMQYYLKSTDTSDSMAKALDRLKEFGFLMADKSGISVSLYDFERIQKETNMTEKIEAARKKVMEIEDYAMRGFVSEKSRRKHITQIWTDLQETCTKSMLNNIDRNSNLFMMIDSGARGDVYQLMEMCGFIGTVMNAKGEILENPALSNYYTGLRVEELFAVSYKARIAGIAQQRSTSAVGETNRGLIYQVNDVVTRETTTACSAKPTIIKLEYALKTPLPFGAVLAISDVDDIPKTLFNERLSYKDWKTFADFIKEFCRTQVIYDTTENFITTYALKRIILKTGENSYQALDLDYKLTDQCQAILWYRVFEPNAFEPSIAKYAKDYLNLSMEYSHDGNETHPVVGNDVISCIEKDMPKTFPIYTIMGCKSTSGVCHRCYGLKYDTARLPEGKEYIGFQAMQAIGEPNQQLMLDLHKRLDASTGGLQALQDLLRDPLSDKGPIAIMAPISGEVSLSKQEDGSVVILIQDEAGQEVPVGAVQSITRLKVAPGMRVETGDQLTYGGVSLTDLLGKVDYINVQLAHWKKFLMLYTGNDIKARNFEILARSQANFGRALEDKNDIYAGQVYSIAKLTANKVAFDPTVLPNSKLFLADGKVFDAMALERTKEVLGIASVKSLKSKMTPLSRMMTGMPLTGDRTRIVGRIRSTDSGMEADLDHNLKKEDRLSAQHNTPDYVGAIENTASGMTGVTKTSKNIPKPKKSRAKSGVVAITHMSAKAGAELIHVNGHTGELEVEAVVESEAEVKAVDNQLDSSTSGNKEEKQDITTHVFSEVSTQD